MKVIDLYIGKRFFSTFFTILFVFILVFSLIHWIDHSGKYAKADVGAILRFYLNYTPQIINLVIPVCGLLSSLLTFSNLGKYNELVALQVSGVSRRRYILPALTLSFLISTALFFFNEYVLIDANLERDRIETVEIYKKTPKKKGEKRNVLLNTKNNGIIFAGNVHIDKGIMAPFNIQYYTNDRTRVIKRIDADSVLWNDSTGWVLKDAYVRHLNADTILSTEYKKHLQIEETSFSPKDFEEPVFRPDRVDKFLTLKELRNFSEKRASFGQTTYHVDYEIYNAFFAPLSIFFMTFIGSILGSMFTKGSVIIYFLACIIICLIYMVVVIIGKVLAQNNEIPALLGASLPHLATLCVLTFLVNKKS